MKKKKLFSSTFAASSQYKLKTEYHDIRGSGGPSKHVSSYGLYESDNYNIVCAQIFRSKQHLISAVGATS